MSDTRSRSSRTASLPRSTAVDLMVAPKIDFAPADLWVGTRDVRPLAADVAHSNQHQSERHELATQPPPARGETRAYDAAAVASYRR